MRSTSRTSGVGRWVIRASERDVRTGALVSLCSLHVYAAAPSVLVTALATYGWWLRRETGSGKRETSPGVGAYLALALLVVQVGLGAVTVKLSLPPWTVILHLGTAMLLLATLIVTGRGRPSARPSRAGLWALGLGLLTVLFGALTPNLGAASACLRFPLCNDQLIPAGNYLQHIHWTHRLLAYTLFGYSLGWAVRTRARGAWGVLALVTLQVVVAAAMVLFALPQPLQAAHVAVGAGVWAALVLAGLWAGAPGQPGTARPAASGGSPR